MHSFPWEGLGIREYYTTRTSKHEKIHRTVRAPNLGQTVADGSQKQLNALRGFEGLCSASTS